MDISAFQAFLSGFGFPTASAIFLAWFIFKIWMNQQKVNEVREDKLIQSISTAQMINRELTKTNSEFVGVLNTYKVDLEEIKSDVAEIKERIEK